MSKIVVTGGLGLIGSTVAQDLARRGHEVHIIDSLDVRAGGSPKNLDQDLVSSVLIADISDPDIWRELPNRIDVIVNLAGLSGHDYSMLNPAEDLRDNVVAHASFLQQLLEQGHQPAMILASTRQVFGTHPSHPRSTSEPADVNAVGRLAMEHLYAVLLREARSRLTILRLSNVYGAAMLRAKEPQGVLGTWLQAAATGEPLRVSLPSPTRDVLHADDLSDLLVTLADEVKGKGRPVQAFEVGGGVPIALLDIAKHLSAISGAEVQLLEEDERSSSFRVGDYVSDISRVRAVYGWSPQRDWRDEMARILHSCPCSAEGNSL